MSSVSSMIEITISLLFAIFPCSVCMFINYIDMFEQFQMWWNERRTETTENYRASRVFSCS